MKRLFRRSQYAQMGGGVLNLWPSTVQSTFESESRSLYPLLQCYFLPLRYISRMSDLCPVYAPFFSAMVRTKKCWETPNVLTCRLYRAAQAQSCLHVRSLLRFLHGRMYWMLTVSCVPCVVRYRSKVSVNIRFSLEAVFTNFHAFTPYSVVSILCKIRVP